MQRALEYIVIFFSIYFFLRDLYLYVHVSSAIDESIGIWPETATLDSAMFNFRMNLQTVLHGTKIYCFYF